MTKSEVEIIERKGWASIEGKGVLTESEWRRIDEIYKRYIKQSYNKIMSDQRSICNTLIIIGSILIVVFIISYVISLIFIGGLLVLSCLSLLLGLALLVTVFLNYPIHWEDREDREDPGDWGDCKRDAESEKYFTMQYFRYLAMKSKLNESEFRKFLDAPYLIPKLKENDKDDLVKIFRNVKERAENMKITDECKTDLTPWEFFKKYFYVWKREVLGFYSNDNDLFEILKRNKRRAELDKCKVDLLTHWEFFKWKREELKFYSNDSKRYHRVCDAYEKVYNYFKELDKAPRISGDLVVELEDVLEENKDIIPVSKDEVMKLVDAWRRYKVEERL